MNATCPNEVQIVSTLAEANRLAAEARRLKTGPGARQILDRWSKDTPPEENPYYHQGLPLLVPSKLKLSGPSVVELFSGCGGLSTGFAWAGFRTVLAADLHLPSLATFGLNHPEAHLLLGDLRKVSEDQAAAWIGEPPDVLCAGIPCQGFSLNNRKRHAADQRNYLFLEMLRFVARLRPRLVVLENVTGLRSSQEGAFAKAIEAGLVQLGFGWVGHRTLNALHYGVPQNRSRLVFVACRDPFPFAWPKTTFGPGTDRPCRTVRDAIGDLPPLEAGQVATQYQAAATHEYQELMRQDQRELLNHRAPNHPAQTVRRIAATPPGEPMYAAFRQRIRLSWNQPSPTQVSGGIRSQFQFGHPDQARGLTIRERCRIQSFPDSYEITGGLVQGRVQTGNAVPPLLAKAIAEACLDRL